MSNTAPQVGAADTGLEPSEIHDVLRNTRRRLALDTLRETEGGELSVRELSERVATLETGEDPPPRNKRQSVYVSLHQTHLPKLDELGIVEYDSDSKSVTLQDRVQQVEIYMDVVPKYGLSWGEYYFALGLLGTLTTIAVLLGVPGIAALGVTVVASGFFIVLMLSATYQVYDQQDRLIFDRILDAGDGGGAPSETAETVGSDDAGGTSGNGAGED